MGGGSVSNVEDVVNHKEEMLVLIWLVLPKCSEVTGKWHAGIMIIHPT